MSEPLRILLVDEGVLGHRTLSARMRAGLAAHPAVEVISASVPPPNRLERLLLRRWRRVGDADLFALRWRLRWSWRLRGMLRRHARRCDVAVIVTQAAALLSRGPMRRLPCVLLVDATVGQFTALKYGGPDDPWTPRQQRLLKWLERRALAGAAALVALTEWNATALRSEYDLADTKLETIHPGVNREWWGQAAVERETDRGEPLRVLFVGNDVERKGLDTLADAVGRLEGEAILEVVTAHPVPEGDLVRVHRGVAAGSPRLRQLYARADVLALPTRADAVPWVVLEGMAAGLPVLATDVGAIVELLGDSGELVPSGDAAAVAAALRRLSDPQRRRRLGAMALVRVRERYDGAVGAQRLLQLLEEVSGRQGPPQGGRRRIRRRTFVAVGAGVTGVALAAPYAVLIPDDEFEHLVASNLDIETGLARQLLTRARSEYGEPEYTARAAAFALAVRDPAAALLPGGVRERAIDGLIEAMLSAPAASLAYGVTGVDPGDPACAGLVRNQ